MLIGVFESLEKTRLSLSCSQNKGELIINTWNLSGNRNSNQATRDCVAGLTEPEITWFFCFHCIDFHCAFALRISKHLNHFTFFLWPWKAGECWSNWGSKQCRLKSSEVTSSFEWSTSRLSALVSETCCPEVVSSESAGDGSALCVSTLGKKMHPRM